MSEIVIQLYEPIFFKQDCSSSKILMKEEITLQWLCIVNPNNLLINEQQLSSICPNIMQACAFYSDSCQTAEMLIILKWSHTHTENTP